MNLLFIYGVAILVSIFPLINIINRVITKKKSGDLLVVIKHKLCFFDFINVLLKTGFYIIFLIIIILQYKIYSMDLKALSIVGRMNVMSPEDYLYLNIVFVIFWTSIILYEAYYGIYSKRNLVRIHEMGMYIYGRFHKWDYIKAFKWVEDTLVLDIDMKILILKKSVDAKICIPSEQKIIVHSIICDNIT